MRNLAIFTFILISIVFSGCTNIIGGMSINNYGQVCVSNGSKVNLHDLIKKVSQNSNSNYEFENEYNSYSTSYVTFKDDRCFSNINDLKSYIDTYTDYTLEINKDRQKNNLMKNEGILLNKVYIKDVFEYLNLVNNTKMKYYDDNLLLNDAIKRIYNINELAKYIDDTTSFKLVTNTLEDGSQFYKLSYKEYASLKKEYGIIFNLEKAKKEVEKLNQETLSIKIEEIISEIRKFN